MEFWTTLIKITKKPTGDAVESLKDNCTHVTGDYWIMEGDVDVLRDDGVECEDIAEGAVGSLGGLNEDQLKQVCLDSYGIRLPNTPESDLLTELNKYVQDEDMPTVEALIRKDREAKKMHLMPDLAWCLGKLRGLGHPNETMEKRHGLQEEQKGGDAN